MTKSKILLVNFGNIEQEKIASLGLDVDLGYISDVYKSTGLEESANFFSPLAIYEYKAIFVKLTKKPPLEISYRDKAKPTSAEDRLNFLKYWREKGILTIFLEDNSFESLFPLGIHIATLRPASGFDATVKFVLDDEERPFRQIFRAEKSSIIMPPAKYIEVTVREGSYHEGNWHIVNIYENLNDQAIGIYYNAKPSYYNEDAPCFVILSAFREYHTIITKLLKVFAKIYPKHIPEIYEADWVDSDKYYPKEVAYFDQQINEQLEVTKKRLEELEKAKNKIKEKYSFLRSILYTSGDELKDAIIKVLSEIWELDVEDMDATRKTDFREDVLIRNNDLITLGEIKGTRNLNPTFTYVTQLLTHLLKSKHRDAVGALILNHDLKRDPTERTNAYTNKDEEEQLKEIIYIDTRILFSLSIAILDYGMPLEEAKNILFQKGRITFDLNEYIKNKVEK